MPMRIRRDRSALSFGGPVRHRRRSSKNILLWLIILGLGGIVLWQNTTFQTRVSALVYGELAPTPSAVELADQAEQAYLVGDLSTSIDLYGRAAELEPNTIGIQFEYVRNLIYGRYAGIGFDYRADIALDVAQAMVEKHPDLAESQAAYALTLNEKNRYDEAAAAALRAIEIAPNWPEAHAYLALVYLNQLRWSDAAQEARLAVSLGPNSVDSRWAYARTLASTGNYQLAIDEYLNAISIHPRLDALYFELAQYYAFTDQYDEAIRAYDRVISNDPRNVKAWTRKCQTLHTNRDDANAAESCLQAIELDPNYPEAFSQLGVVLYYARDYKGAIDAFSHCVDLMNEQNWVMTDRLEKCYYVQGLAYYLDSNQCSKAMPLFEQAFLVDLSSGAREKTLEGMQLCTGAPVDESTLPTDPQPTPEATTEGVEIF